MTTRLILWAGSTGYVIVKDMSEMDLNDEDDCEEILDNIRAVRRRMDGANDARKKHNYRPRYPVV